jgi:hypothetical protein
VKKPKNCSFVGLRATLSSLKIAVRPSHGLDLSWIYGLGMHFSSDCDFGYDCNCDSCCESQIVTKRHSSWTFFGGTPSDSLKVSIVGVLLQENPVLTIQTGMDDSSDLYLGVCWHDPGTSLLWENATASFSLLFPPERWP